MDYEVKESIQCFSGNVVFASFRSDACRGEVGVSIYNPPQAQKKQCPAIIFLSGLTCTEENFMIKSGAQRVAAELGIIVVAPDTSPRNTGIAEATKSYDLGEGASFYVNATQNPWKQRFQMYDLVTQEIPALLRQEFAWDHVNLAISGHSMGGHGALVIGLRNPELFKSISAFAPICAPSFCPWGKKAFTAYLGENPTEWQNYDASLLLANSGEKRPPILIDQGLDDQFLAEQLMPEKIVSAAKSCSYPLSYRQHARYDHSYYFVSSFIEEHLNFHLGRFS